MPQMVGSIPWNLIHGRINNGLNGLVNMDGTQGLALLGKLGILMYLGLWIIMMNCKCMGIEARQGNNNRNPRGARTCGSANFPVEELDTPSRCATPPPPEREPEPEPILCVHGTRIRRPKTKMVRCGPAQPAGAKHPLVALLEGEA